jgi:hypothetical protein
MFAVIIWIDFLQIFLQNKFAFIVQGFQLRKHLLENLKRKYL